MSEYQNNLNGEENSPLSHVPGTGVEQPEDTSNEVIGISEEPPACCCNDKYHRKLAIASIVCGFSCCGVPSLVYSVKAENAEKAKRTTDKKSTKYLQEAKKWGIISIVMWVCLLVSASLVLVLVLLLLVPDCTQLGEIC